MSELSIKIQPLGDRVVIMPIKRDPVRASGIVIPDTSSPEKPSEGVVIALGSGGTTKDAQNPQDFLKVGDTVLFGRYAGDEIKVKDVDQKDVEVRILRLDGVLGIIK